MLVRAPLMEAQQHGSIRVADLTPMVMTRSRFGLPKERLVPSEAERNVSDADDCPCALHYVFPPSPDCLALGIGRGSEIASLPPKNTAGTAGMTTPRLYHH